MTVLFSPFGNAQIVDSNGNPAVGYTVKTYVAGSNTLLASYTDATGLSANGTVTLNATGRNPNGQFWLTAGRSYKFVVADADGVVVQTVDGITGTNDPSVIGSIDEWVSFAATPTYTSATTFTLAGDQTSTFQVKRRIKSTNTGGTTYSTISASAFAAGITTVTLVNSSGVLDAGLSAVSYGLLSVTNYSIPDLYPAIGYSQTWQDVTASRALTTTYTNSTTRPIMVVANVNFGASTSAQSIVNAQPVGLFGNSNVSGINGSFTFVVPPGQTYSIGITGGAPTLGTWRELR